MHIIWFHFVMDEIAKIVQVQYQVVSYCASLSQYDWRIKILQFNFPIYFSEYSACHTYFCMGEGVGYMKYFHWSRIWRLWLERAPSYNESICITTRVFAWTVSFNLNWKKDSSFQKNQSDISENYHSRPWIQWKFTIYFFLSKASFYNCIDINLISEGALPRRGRRLNLA